jgi:hypothetical protein
VLLAHAGHAEAGEQEGSAGARAVEDPRGEPHQGPAPSAETVIGVERTRATFLSCTEQNEAGFTADLQALVMPGSHRFVSGNWLAMAPTAT